MPNRRQSPTALLELSFFRWSPALQAAVSTVYNAGWHTLGLRRLSHLDQEVTTQPPSPFPSLRKVEFRDTITDTHLTTVLAHVPTVDMCAGTFALTAALPADAARPWRAIETPQHTKMAEWLTQAELLGGDPCWQHKGIILSLSADEVRGLLSYSRIRCCRVVPCALCAWAPWVCMSCGGF